MLTNVSVPSVSAVSLVHFESEHDDRANHFYEKFPQISADFRHLSYRLYEHFHLISI